MATNDHTWAIVLAGGEGRRLRALARTPEGLVIPKQYCSLRGGPSLLQEALLRADLIAPEQQICVVVANRHRALWQSSLSSLAAGNVLVEPLSRGTAIGILLGAVHVLAADQRATLVILPADHYIGDQPVLTDAIRTAVAYVNAHPQSMVLLGMEPDSADPELGYVVPATSESNDIAQVKSFCEKPTEEEARELIRSGAMWNSFILVAGASALIDKFDACFPEIVKEFRTVLAHTEHRPGELDQLTALYLRLPVLDFSHDVLERLPFPALRVLRTPRCDWTDLGTPKRLIQTLHKLSMIEPSTNEQLSSSAPLILSNACKQFSSLDPSLGNNMPLSSTIHKTAHSGKTAPTYAVGRQPTYGAENH